MDVTFPEGKYIVAVSGGVDSMVLLDVLANYQLPTTNYQLIVAYFNHGIRPDSGEDEKFVVEAVKRHGLPVEVGYGRLGPNASEETARKARYKFLRGVKEKYQAKAIITAHHQDDLIETAFINILRGSGRRGLTAITQESDVLRPLLKYPKSGLLKYAKDHKLKWREDPTNLDTRYLRNYVRQNLVKSLSSAQRNQVLENISKLQRVNKALDQEIATISQNIQSQGVINRQKFISLPPEIADEVLIYMLRQAGVRQFDKKTIGRLAMAIKTAKAGTIHDILQGATLQISKNSALLATPTQKS